jgi:PhzF family phenazine biosynthesis protein
VLSKANSRLLIGLRSPDTLASLQPDMEALIHLTPKVGADGFFVFAMKPDGGVLTTEARMFCPVIGIPEDPVSGNAHGMLGVYLLSNGLLAASDGVARFVGHQGRFMERPGTVEVEVTASGKRATSVSVAGQAVTVYRAELEL